MVPYACCKSSKPPIIPARCGIITVIPGLSRLERQSSRTASR
jgi:hypothetical protein